MSSVRNTPSNSSDDTIEDILLQEQELVPETEEVNDIADVSKKQLSGELLEEKAATGKLNSFNNKLQRFSRFIGTHFLKILFAISLGFVYLEYDQSIEQRKTTTSFDMVKDWEARDIAEDYSTFVKRVDLLANKASKLLVEVEDEADKKILIANYVKKNLFSDIPSTDDEAISRILYFYNKIGLCIDAELCETNFLIEFFGDSAKVFWFYYKDHAYKKRILLKNHADYTERFVRETE